TFGAMLRRRRLAADVTQAQLAALSGLSARGIQNLESDTARPRHETVERLAHALGLDDRHREQFLAAGRPHPRRRGTPRSNVASAGLAAGDWWTEGGSLRLLTDLSALPVPVSRFVG